MRGDMARDDTAESDFGTKGILKPRAGARRFRLTRHRPARDLAFFVQRYWIVRWNLEGRDSYGQETLPYPCVNLVFEEGASAVFGVVRRKFSRVLEGSGRVLGIKFRPGGFHPFARSSVSELTDGSVDLEEAFGVDARALEAAILPLDDEAMVERAEAFLRERLPERDENVERVNRIVERIIADPEITKVDDVVRRIDMGKRTLQRLFRRYVGVGPKWVIQRYRLQEAADRLAGDEAVDLARMALELGYFDQAHFINDFKAIVGVSPAEYARGAG